MDQEISIKSLTQKGELSNLWNAAMIGGDGSWSIGGRFFRRPESNTSESFPEKGEEVFFDFFRKRPLAPGLFIYSHRMNDVFFKDPGHF